MSKQRKIFVGPDEIASFNKNLCDGLKELDVEYDFITYSPHPFGYGGETSFPFLLKISQAIEKQRISSSFPGIFKYIFLFFEMLFKSFWGCIAIFRYDVFLFCFGKSLLPFNIDLPILSILGKKVISNIALGSESRPAYINGALNAKDGTLASLSQIRDRSKRSKNLVSWHSRFATLVIGAPFSTSQFSPSFFINWFCLGFPSADPINTDKLPACDLDSESAGSSTRSVRILHSPSHPAMKGTSIIENAVNNLKARGYSIEFILIHGRPFSEVLEEIQKCDFVVDQVYSDTPMAGFAKEAAWFGKCAVVGGYGLEQLRQFVADEMWPPSEICHPQEVENSIERLIVDVDYRNRLGRDAQEFVRSRWSAREVAKRYLRLINKDIPDTWWFDPDIVVYTQGAGQSEAESQQKIAGLVERYGVASLQLSRRPELEKAFLRFSGANADRNDY